MDSKLKQRIIQSLRRFTYSYKPRAEAQKKMKVEAATFACEHCGVWMYTGKSDKNYEKLKDKYPNRSILKEPVKMDHILPIVCTKAGWVSWDVYIERMFCDEESFQCLCTQCHNVKSKIEAGERKLWRAKKKNQK